MASGRSILFALASGSTIASNVVSNRTALYLDPELYQRLDDGVRLMLFVPSFIRRCIRRSHQGWNIDD